MGLNIQQQGLELRRDLSAQGGKPPSGYRWTQQGNLEAIPGGPGDQKIQATQLKSKEHADRVQGVADDIDTLVNMLSAKPDIAGGRGIVSRGIESVMGVLDPTAAPSDAHLFQSRLQDLKTRIQLMRADKRFSKAAMERMDKIVQGEGLGQNAATSIATLQDMKEKLLRDISTSQQPTGTPPRIASEADYNALPKGSKYVDPDGKIRTKQ